MKLAFWAPLQYKYKIRIPEEYSKEKYWYLLWLLYKTFRVCTGEEFRVFRAFIRLL